LQSNVVVLRTRRPLEQANDGPAQFYRFAGDPERALANDRFMDKAAAFQEIKDCLAAFDHNELSAYEAEGLIRYFVRSYLDIH
jgi:hypothetical protein